jgi:hypothetical protein
MVFSQKTLQDDAIIDEHRRPWSAKPDARILAEGSQNQTSGHSTPTE